MSAVSLAIGWPRTYGETVKFMHTPVRSTYKDVVQADGEYIYRVMFKSTVSSLYFLEYYALQLEELVFCPNGPALVLGDTSQTHPAYRAMYACIDTAGFVHMAAYIRYTDWRGSNLPDPVYCEASLIPKRKVSEKPIKEIIEMKATLFEALR